MTKTKKRVWPRVLLVFALVIAGLALYFVLFPKKLAKFILPDFSKVEEVDGFIHNDSLHLNARGVFESETFLPLVVDSLGYTFYVEDCVLYAQKKQIDLQLSPGEADTVNIAVHVPFDRIRHISKYIRPMDSVMIGVRCQVVYKYFGRHITLRFKKEGKILRPVPPRISLAGLGKKKISDWGKNITTEARLRVMNESKKLRVGITGLAYTIYVGKDIRGHGHYDLPIELQPGKTLYVNIPVELVMDKPVKTAWKLLFDKDRVPYRIEATALVDFHSRKKPNKIRVNLTTTGSTLLTANK